MRRERDWSYITYRPENTGFRTKRRLTPTLHKDKSFLPKILRSLNRTAIISGRHLPLLSELKRIKETKIRRIKDMVRKGTYDTIERQIETARRITTALLAEKYRGN